MDSIRSIIKKLNENRLLEARASYKDMDHDDLIRMAQDGDQTAFEELLVQYDPLISKQARRYFFDAGSGDQEDVKQVASIAFWEAVSSYDPTVHKHGFSAYANLIMSRKLTDMLRKEDADVRKINNLAGSLDDKVVGDDGDSGTVGDRVASKGLSPEEEVLGQEGADELEKFMREKFSPKELEVVRLKAKGYKNADIMEVTGLSYKQVENTLKRIKDKLAEYMRKSYKESKQIRESKEIEFTDEEKRVLESVLNKIDAEGK